MSEEILKLIKDKEDAEFKAANNYSRLEEAMKKITLLLKTQNIVSDVSL